MTVDVELEHSYEEFAGVGNYSMMRQLVTELETCST
jgi:hypothetical protein